MRKYTQKEIKNLITIGAAKDITNYDCKNMNDFLHSRSLEKIGYSAGIYGISGGVLQDIRTNELFAITARTTVLFMAF